MGKKLMFEGALVLESNFKTYPEQENLEALELNINGKVLVPKEIKEEDDIRVTLDITMGNEKQRLHFQLKFMSIYLIKDINIDEKEIRSECLSDALKRLKIIIEKNLLLYGLEKIEFPDFPTKG